MRDIYRLQKYQESQFGFAIGPHIKIIPLKLFTCVSDRVYVVIVVSVLDYFIKCLRTYNCTYGEYVLIYLFEKCCFKTARDT